MALSLGEILPQREWWRQTGTMEEYCEKLAAKSGTFRSLTSTMLASLPWSHRVEVKNNDTGRPGYFCGEACCVEVANISFLGRQRLAVWWTGERIGQYIQYCSVQPGFLLVPYIETLGKRVLEVIVGCGYKRVTHDAQRPKAGQFWLERHFKEDRIVLQFHTRRSGNRARQALTNAGLVYSDSLNQFDVALIPVDNIIR